MLSCRRSRYPPYQGIKPGQKYKPVFRIILFGTNQIRFTSMQGMIFLKLKLFVALAVCFVLAAPALAAADYSLFVNGAPVYSDVSPEVVGREVLLPLRAVAEALGAVVSYDEIGQTVYVNKYDLSVEIPIGKHTGMKNGHTILLAAPPKIINSRTLITREALRNALGVKTTFNVHMNCIFVE